jgi:hypothetical protein
MKREGLRDDLHPEELLVKASQGALGVDEEADLRAHVERCPACALQLELREDVELALAPTDFDYEVGARAVERLAASTDWGAQPRTRLLGIGRPPVAARAAFVLAIVLGTGVAASAVVLGTRGHLWDVRPPEPAASGGAANHAPRVRAKKAAAEVVEPEALAVAPPAVPLAVAPPAVSTPQATVALPAASSAPAARASRELTARDVERAGEYFGAAERARREGNVSEARRLYGLLAAGFAGTREELASRVLRGQMYLDDLDDAAAALRSFDLYLRDQPSGALAEEALVGRAQALRRLGRAAAETEAWSELLALHPRSLQAELARERLAALAGRGE